jgi:hypothetical protein
MSVKRRISTLWTIVGAWLSAVLLSACTTTTLLEVRFDADTPGAPPSVTQTMGTVLVDNGGGSVVVVDRPATDLAAGNWARIAHPTSNTPQTSMRAMMSAPAGDGSFTITTLLYVPTGGAVATIQLEPFGLPESSYASFLHVDLLADGTVRINDGAQVFGHYPHDQVFILSIDMDVSGSGATARVALAGADTSGSADVAIPLLSFARQFGAVRIWMGYQFSGQFYVDDVLVVKRES